MTDAPSDPVQALFDRAVELPPEERAAFLDAAQAESLNVENRRFATRQLRLWQYHRAFAGLRVEAELKKLPEEEQKEWRKFWTEVAALVTRAAKR